MASSERPLWSERQGQELVLTDDGFRSLIAGLTTQCKNLRLFEEALGIQAAATARLGHASRGRGIHDPTEFFVYRLGDPWAADALDSPDVYLIGADRDRVFDLLEVLYREVVSKPAESSQYPLSTYDKAEGQRFFRDSINRILNRATPPSELNEAGEIVQSVPVSFARLVEQPLPPDTPKREVSDRVDDAVTHFRRRGASPGDRRAAVRELADVLEYLRIDVKLHLLREDEAALFRLANEFAIRHNKRETRRDFDESIWLAWAFYVYLATIRLVLELKRRGTSA